LAQRRTESLVTLSLPESLVALVGSPDALPHLEQALTHPSYANEHKRPHGDYQRLEFLGDAVLGLGVSEILVAKFPDAREGELSLMRASIVSTEALAAFAESVGLGPALLLGRGADAAREREQPSVLADAIEAIIAAVYLDRGFVHAKRIIEEIAARGLASPKPARDPKSELQEKVQARGAASPVYRLVEASGPDHQRQFVVVVEAQGEVLGEGRGRSKKAAEQGAARAGLAKLAQSAPPPDSKRRGP
jgi:ribonuclease-3